MNALLEAAKNLRDHLQNDEQTLDEIPPAVWKPFADAVLEAETAPPAEVK